MMALQRHKCELVVVFHGQVVFTRNVSGFLTTAVDKILGEYIPCLLLLVWWKALVLGQALLLLRMWTAIPRRLVP